MRTTAQIRSAWAPACQPRLVEFTAWTGATYPQGIDDRCQEAFSALDAVFEAWGYRPAVGWCWGYLCRKITGGSGYSLHAYGVCLDVNAPKNPYGPRLVTDMPRPMVEAGLAIRANGGHRVFGWGGNYRNNKDAMHWEVVASPAELVTGIDWSTVAGANEEDDMTGEQSKKLDDLHVAMGAVQRELAEVEVRQRQLKYRDDAILAILRQAFPALQSDIDAILAKLDG